jgi:hypothetical protein
MDKMISFFMNDLAIEVPEAMVARTPQWMEDMKKIAVQSFEKDKISDDQEIIFHDLASDFTQVEITGEGYRVFTYFGFQKPSNGHKYQIRASLEDKDMVVCYTNDLASAEMVIKAFTPKFDDNIRKSPFLGEIKHNLYVKEIAA